MSSPDGKRVRPKTAQSSRRSTYNRSNRVTPLALDKVLPVIINGTAVPPPQSTTHTSAAHHDTPHTTPPHTPPPPPEQPIQLPQTLSRASSMANIQLHRPLSIDTDPHTTIDIQRHHSAHTLTSPTSPTPLIRHSHITHPYQPPYHPVHSKIARTLDTSLNVILVAFTFPWITIAPLLTTCLKVQRNVARLIETSALCVGGISNAVIIIVLVRIHALDESSSYQSTEVAYGLFCCTFSLLALTHYIISVWNNNGPVNAKKFDVGLLHLFAVDLDELHVTDEQLVSLSWVYVLVSFVPALIGALISNYFYTDDSYRLVCKSSSQASQCSLVNSAGQCCTVQNDSESDINTFIGILAGNIATGYLFVQRIAIFILRHNRAPPTLSELVCEAKDAAPQSPKSVIG